MYICLKCWVFLFLFFVPDLKAWCYFTRSTVTGKHDVMTKYLEFVELPHFCPT